MAGLWIVVGKRLLAGLMSLFLVSLIIFVSIELLPGDAAQAILGQFATTESLHTLRRELGLDQPLIYRYVHWLGGMVTGDFGVSMVNKVPIADLIGLRLGNTIFLALYAAGLAVPLAIVLGLMAALFRNTFFDRAMNIVALSSISLPEFFLAFILIYLFTQNGTFPATADVTDATAIWTRLYRTFLPAVTLTFVVTAHMMRMTRASIINLLASAYIEMARLKGVPAWRVIVVHALPNALSPIINVVVLNLAYLITGVIVVEVVFVYPGLGQLMVDSVSKRDVPVVQAVAMLFAAAYVLLNLVADLISTLSNPRLRDAR
jgi:peptide/nickel transport system permease protein